MTANKVSNLWTESGVTWVNYAGAQAWTSAGGDLGNQEGQESISGALSSYTMDISAMGLTWGGNGAVILRDASDIGSTVQFNSLQSGAAIAALPRVTSRYLKVK